MPNIPSEYASRRKLIKRIGLVSGAAILSPVVHSLSRRSPNSSSASNQTAAFAEPTPIAAAGLSPHRVVLVNTADRAAGIKRAIELLQPPSFSGQKVFIKPNYNTGDSAPASTDPTVLESLVQVVQAEGASGISVGDRSGMATTREAMEQQKVFSLADQYGFTPVVLTSYVAMTGGIFRARGVAGLEDMRSPVPSWMPTLSLTPAVLKLIATAVTSRFL